jgi:hypothetical protein
VIDLKAEAELSASLAEFQRLATENLAAMRALARFILAPRPPAPRLSMCDYSDEYCNCRDFATVHNCRAEMDVCLYHHQHIDREIEKGRWECAQ